MHDTITMAFRERWRSSAIYNKALTEILRGVVIRGREVGQFERKTPSEETCEAIRYTTEPFFPSILLELDSGAVLDEAKAMADLVLRSLLK